MKRAIFSIILFFCLLQFYHIDRKNPAETDPILASPEVMSILSKSCYDCHSYKTTWPNYSYLFPISLLISNHVSEGRGELNFSTWEKLSAKKKATLAYTIMEEIEEGEMPITGYTILHPKAKLTEEEIEILRVWSDKMEEEYAKAE